MKAAVYKGNGELSVEEWKGRMPEEKEVQIRVSYCGICGSDIHILQGSEDHRMQLPSVIGHECSGTVWRVGSRVESVRPGDRVVVWPVKACKECFACKEGYGHVCQNLKVRGIETDGAFQYAWTVDEEALVRLPDTVSMLHGAYSGRIRKARRYPARYSCRYRSCSTHAQGGGRLCTVGSPCRGVYRSFSRPFPRSGSRRNILSRLLFTVCNSRTFAFFSRYSL